MKPFQKLSLWQGLCKGAWYAIVVESNPTAGKSALIQFMQTLQWRLKNKIDENEFETLHHEWIKCGKDEPYYTVRSTKVSLQDFQQIIIEQQFQIKDLKFIIALLANESNKREMKLKYFSASWLAIIEQVFFELDGSGYGFITIDNIFTLALLQHENESILFPDKRRDGVDNEQILKTFASCCVNSMKFLGSRDSPLDSPYQGIVTLYSLKQTIKRMDSSASKTHPMNEFQLQKILIKLHSQRTKIKFGNRIWYDAIVQEEISKEYYRFALWLLERGPVSRYVLGQNAEWQLWEQIDNLWAQYQTENTEIDVEEKGKLFTFLQRSVTNFLKKIAGDILGIDDFTIESKPQQDFAHEKETAAANIGKRILNFDSVEEDIVSPTIDPDQAQSGALYINAYHLFEVEKKAELGNVENVNEIVSNLWKEIDSKERKSYLEAAKAADITKGSNPKRSSPEDVILESQKYFQPFGNGLILLKPESEYDTIDSYSWSSVPIDEAVEELVKESLALSNDENNSFPRRHVDMIPASHVLQKGDLEVLHDFNGIWIPIVCKLQYLCNGDGSSFNLVGFNRSNDSEIFNFNLKNASVRNTFLTVDKFRFTVETSHTTLNLAAKTSLDQDSWLNSISFAILCGKKDEMPRNGKFFSIPQRLPPPIPKQSARETIDDDFQDCYDSDSGGSS